MPIGVIRIIRGQTLDSITGQDARLPHRLEACATSALKHDQLEPALHFRRDAIPMIKTSADRRDIRRP